MFALFIEKFENDERKLELKANKLILSITSDDENGKCNHFFFKSNIFNLAQIFKKSSY